MVLDIIKNDTALISGCVSWIITQSTTTRWLAAFPTKNTIMSFCLFIPSWKTETNFSVHCTNSLCFLDSDTVCGDIQQLLSADSLCCICVHTQTALSLHTLIVHLFIITQSWRRPSAVRYLASLWFSARLISTQASRPSSMLGPASFSSIKLFSLVDEPYLSLSLPSLPLLLPLVCPLGSLKSF